MSTGRAEELRRAFDRSFAEPPDERVVHFEDLISIRVGGDPFALRVRDVMGLFANKKVTSLPSPLAELVGVAGFRGGVVPVYDLRLLLGYPAREPTRWMALVTTPPGPRAPARPLALGFDRFEAHLRVSPDAVAAEAVSARLGYVREVVRLASGTTPIVHVTSLLEAIMRRGEQPSTAQRER